MSSSESGPDRLPALSEAIDQLTDEILATGEADIGRVPEVAVQQLMTSAYKLYVAMRELDIDFPPFLEEQMTATDVAVVTHQALKQVEMQLFELTLWQGLGKD
jgi:hypothetical protein